jgi:hypothetical protein
VAKLELNREEIEQRLDELSAAYLQNPHDEYLKAEIIRLKKLLDEWRITSEK